MLSTFQDIVHQVSNANNLEDALTIVVGGVKQAMSVDACSVYIRNAGTGHFLMMASNGLDYGSGSKIERAATAGLIELVAARQELINLENAAEHQAYHSSPETGADPYHGFLGVPLIHFRKLLGVICVQRRARLAFAKDDVAFLVTIAAQLAEALSAAAPDGVITIEHDERVLTVSFNQGLSGAPGIAIGTIVLPSPLANFESVADRALQDTTVEEAAFREAVSAVQKELRKGAESMATRLPSEARALFDVYELMLGSDSLVNLTIERIRAGNWAPGSLRETIAELAGTFEQMDDPYLRGRAEDIRGIGRRILLYLQSDSREPRGYPQRCVLLGDEVSLARIAEVPAEQLAGVVCLRGSVLSHVAIVSKALGVPAVMGLGKLPIGDLEGRTIVVDGYQGRIFIDPTPSVVAAFERLVKVEREHDIELRKFRNLPAKTLDGVPVSLNVNIGLLSETKAVAESGADGVGLYRSEFHFMTRRAFPVEDELYQTYREVLQSFAPKPVTMRTLDVGGDKPLPYYPMDEENPALGWRGIRFSLDHPEIFLQQLRAMLRANAGLNNLRILFPMITQVGEFKEARMLLERAHHEHQEDGTASSMPPVGAMLEVPSVFYQIPALAAHVDFFSIGTNDLTQYLLAVDRSNPNVARLYDPLHPAVLQILRHVITVARRYEKPVSVCAARWPAICRHDPVA
ncbi:MAG: phosphoenolpyruvate--protein phosphotransferase [Gammaproteobacteria bacterium]